jgi:RDD family
MNAKHLRWIFVVLLSIFLVIAFIPDLLPKGSLGFSIETVDGRTSISGGTHPALICFAVVFMLLYTNLMLAEAPTTGISYPGVFRRFVAFYVDFLFSMLTITPLIGIIPMFVEWKTTGVFEWTFERNTSAPSDPVVLAITMLAGGSALLLWYALPLVLGRPSPGCLVLRYQIVSVEAKPIPWRTAISRVLLGFIAACAALIAPFVARDRKKGQFWLDKVFDTRAVKITSK